MPSAPSSVQCTERPRPTPGQGATTLPRRAAFCLAPPRPPPAPLFYPARHPPPPPLCLRSRSPEHLPRSSLALFHSLQHNFMGGRASCSHGGCTGRVACARAPPRAPATRCSRQGWPTPPPHTPLLARHPPPGAVGPRQQPRARGVPGPPRQYCKQVGHTRGTGHVLVTSSRDVPQRTLRGCPPR